MNELWIIDNDKRRIKLYKDCLEEEGLLDKLRIKQFNVLAEAYEKVGTPDFILIDTTSIMGGVTIYGCFDTAVSICRSFAKKHTSANICIQSAVKRWAEDIVEDIKIDFEDCVVEAIEADGSEFIKWIKKYMEK